MTNRTRKEVTWEETIRSPDSGKFPDSHHSSGFAHRALARVGVREPYEAFQTGLRWFFTVDQGFEIGLVFRYKLQLQMAFGGMIINTIVPDFHKPGWQNMQGEPAQELHSVEDYWLFNSTVPVVFGKEGHLSVSDVQKALVCNRYPVRILPEVFHHVIRTGQRRFAIHNPTGVVRLLYIFVEQRKFILLTQGALQAVEEFALKGITQLMYRIQILARMANVLPPTIKRISGSRNNTVNVWV